MRAKGNFLLLAAIILLGLPPAEGGEKTPPTVGILLPSSADSPLRIAAEELAAGLGELYGDRVFRVFTGEAPGGVREVIQLATRASGMDPSLAGRLEGAESYAVATTRVGGRIGGLIAGGDSRAVMYGVHGLLRKLGHGQYLSFHTVRQERNEPFGFGGWDLADRPLVPRRILFNWHNFLSGCSTWNLEHWRRWITRSQRMGFNTVMVHAYGNNPMAGFRFRGRDKPVGYLGSTRLGRSWFVQHAGDVRRMHGGFVFERPVFGSTAAVDGTSRDRTVAAQGLMRRVFQHAGERGVDIIFALDIDTRPANPQELITLLDESERFPSGGYWLPDPETEGGYDFYRAQVAGLLRAYPQIDILALWHRTGGTPWMRFRREEMPRSWQEQYDAIRRDHPGTDRLWHGPHLFGMAKVAAACRRALREIGREEVSLAFGSWHYSFLEGADRFLPEGVSLIPLDWMVLVGKSQLRDAESRKVLKKIAGHRPVLPVVWAHHDDGAYGMRPFRPFDNFQDRLDDARCSAHGYGILHWMTRPLDLYFTSLARQTWSRTRNEPFRETCRRAARDWFGPSREEALGRYLQQWVEEAPVFARETGDWFIDRPLGEPGPIARKAEERIGKLQEIDVSELPSGARQRLEYFRGIEKFTAEIHRLEGAFRRAHRLIEEGRLPEAREVASSLRGQPGRVIRELAGTLRRDGITRGEQGLIVTLNTRWLPHYVRLRQRLGLEPIRFNFGPTVHDPIAPRPGRFTLHFDPRKNIWQTLGEKETGARVCALPVEKGPAPPPGIDEIRGQGIEIVKPLVIPLRPILYGAYGRKDIKQSPRLSAGRYRLKIWRALPADGGGTGFQLTVTCNEIPVGRITGKGDGAGSGSTPLECPITLEKPGEVRLLIKPREGILLLAGLVLEPLAI